MGHGDILVMGDLNWAMYPPPPIEILWQIWHDQFTPPPEKKIRISGLEMKTWILADYGSR